MRRLTVALLAIWATRPALAVPPPTPVPNIDDPTPAVVLAGTIRAVSTPLRGARHPPEITVRVDDVFRGKAPIGQDVLIHTLPGSHFGTAMTGERMIFYVNVIVSNSTSSIQEPFSIPVGPTTISSAARPVPAQQRLIEAVAAVFTENDPMQLSRQEGRESIVTLGQKHAPGEQFYGMALESLLPRGPSLEAEDITISRKAFDFVLPYTAGVGRTWLMAAAMARGDMRYFNQIVDIILHDKTISPFLRGELEDSLGFAAVGPEQENAVKPLLISKSQDVREVGMSLIRNIAEKQPVAILALEPFIDTADQTDVEIAIGSVCSALQICGNYTWKYLQMPQNRAILHEEIQRWKADHSVR